VRSDLDDHLHDDTASSAHATQSCSERSAVLPRPPSQTERRHPRLEAAEQKRQRDHVALVGAGDSQERPNGRSRPFASANDSAMASHTSRLLAYATLRGCERLATVVMIEEPVTGHPPPLRPSSALSRGAAGGNRRAWSFAQICRCPDGQGHADVKCSRSPHDAMARLAKLASTASPPTSVRLAAVSRSAS